MERKDQYNRPVPEPLVVLDRRHYSFFNEDDFDKIESAPWYTVDGFLLVPFNNVKDLGMETDPIDAGINLAAVTELQKVDDVLKRWNVDCDDCVYFYHA